MDDALDRITVSVDERVIDGDTPAPYVVGKQREQCASCGKELGALAYGIQGYSGSFCSSVCRWRSFLSTGSEEQAVWERLVKKQAKKARGF